MVNWNSNRYAAICDYAIKQYNIQVTLCGGPRLIENECDENISALCEKKPLNLIGQTNIKQLLALLEKQMWLSSQTQAQPTWQKQLAHQ